MHQRQRVRPRQQYLKQCKEGIHCVLGDVAPRAEDGREPRRGVEDTPVDDRDDEGVDDYSGVEEGIEGLEGTRKTRERGSAS